MARKRKSDEEKQDTRRARWQRNKRAERARKRPAPPEPLTSSVLQAIAAERDRRRTRGKPYDLMFGAHDHGWGSHEFHCDVWAVRTLLQAQGATLRVTAGKVALHMAEIGLSHGYKPATLRTMVYRAYDAIERMEAPNKDRHWRPHRPPVWEPFDPFADD